MHENNEEDKAARTDKRADTGIDACADSNAKEAIAQNACVESDSQENEAHVSGDSNPRSLKSRILKHISPRLTLYFFLCMLAIYLFSMFGGMLSSPGFTYAEF